MSINDRIALYNMWTVCAFLFTRCVMLSILLEVFFANWNHVHVHIDSVRLFMCFVCFPFLFCCFFLLLFCASFMRIALAQVFSRSISQRECFEAKVDHVSCSLNPIERQGQKKYTKAKWTDEKWNKYAHAVVGFIKKKRTKNMCGLWPQIFQWKLIWIFRFCFTFLFPALVQCFNFAAFFCSATAQFQIVQLIQ